MTTILKRIRHFFRILKLMCHEFAQCCSYTGFLDPNESFQKWRLLLLAHSIEKGLSICDSRPDFGVQKATDLLDIMDKTNGLLNTFEFREAVSVLSQYCEHRKKNNLDISFCNDRLRKYNSVQSVSAGYSIIPKNELSYDYARFKELCNKRHSVREYSKEWVSAESIKEVIQLASTSPSACNRQMIKVFFSPDENDNIELAKTIPGNNGTREEHATYLYIAADRTAFDWFESEQWLLNGGIFLSYLSLGFTAKGIGNCIYQWPIQWKSESVVRNILNIPNKFSIVAVLAVGNYKQDVKVLASCRKNAQEYYIAKGE